MSVRLLSAVSCLLFLASCSACSPSEWAAEKLIEKATGLSVNEEEGTVTFKGKEGVVTFTDGGEEGSITVQGNDGEVIRIGSAGKEVPKGFPLPIFAGAKIEASMSMGKGKEQSYTLQLAIPSGSTQAAAVYYEKELRRKGLEVERTEFDIEEVSTVQLSANDGAAITSSVTVWSAGSEDEAAVTITWSRSAD